MEKELTLYLKDRNALTNKQTNKHQCVVIGRMDNTLDHTYESANRVYSCNALSPTIPTCAGGNIQPKVLVKI